MLKDQSSTQSSTVKHKSHCLVID